MTDLLTLTWASDNEADQDTLNLLGFISGLELANNGWIPQIAPIGAQEVTETLTFYSRALSHDAMAARLQLLDDWITRINVSRDPTQRRVVCLMLAGSQRRTRGERLCSVYPTRSMRHPLGRSCVMIRSPRM